MTQPKDLPSSTFADGNYGAGANPWNSQAKRVAPVNYYFTPNTKPPAEEMNHLVGALWDATKGLLAAHAVAGSADFVSHYDLRARPFVSTVAGGATARGASASWSDANYASGYIDETTTSSTSILVPIDVEPGSIIHSVSLAVQGAATGSLPGTMPAIQLVRQNLTTGVVAGVGSAVNDPSGSVGAYTTLHTLSTGVLDATVDAGYAYFIALSTGSGGGKTTGFRLYVHSVVVSDTRETRAGIVGGSVVLDLKHLNVQDYSDANVSGTWFALLSTSNGSIASLIKSRDGGHSWDFLYNGSSVIVNNLGSTVINLVDGWGDDQVWLFPTAGNDFRKHVISTGTWSNVTTPVASATWYDSAQFAVGSLLIILGKNGTTPKLATYNGTTWTDRSASIGGTWSTPGAVCCSPTTALVWYDTNLYTSTNGTTWTSRTAPDTLHCVCWSDSLGLFVANADADIYTSADGITWASQGTAPANFSSIAARGYLLVAISARADSDDYQHWYSTDSGATWTQAPNSRHPRGDYYSSMARRNGAHVGKLAVSAGGDQLASYCSQRMSFTVRT